MSESIERILAIVRTDVRFRFRRTAALVIMLLVAAGVYLVVPDVSTGRTLIQINGARVLYTSAAVALGTAMFCSIVLSLVGYYLVSNSFRRDILTRTGIVIAATPVTGMEYIIGKFAGNALYLTGVMLTCMASAMLMFLIRGEAALQPLTFIAMYCWIILPGIAFCSATALAFEALPLLSGRFGDFVFFFFWAALVGFPAAIIQGGSSWLAMFDILGIVPIIGTLQDQFHTNAMSIGATDFDAAQAPVLFAGVPWSWTLIGLRLSVLAIPVAMLALARLWFHRFNPTKVKTSIRHSRSNPVARLNVLLKPLTRVLHPFSTMGGMGGMAGESRASIMTAVRADVVTTLLLSPLSVVAIAVFAVIGLSVDVDSLRFGVLPAIIGALIIVLADIAPRDRAAGMMSLLYTAPKLKMNYIVWKFISTLLIVFCFTLIPMIRLVPKTLSLLVGSVFIACGAVGLGAITRGQKAFVALFLMLLYISLNAKDVPAFDFAGFYGHATPAVLLSYAALSALLLAAAHLRHRMQLRDNG